MTNARQLEIVDELPIHRQSKEITPDLLVDLENAEAVAETRPGAWLKVASEVESPRRHLVLKGHGCEVRALRLRDGSGAFIRSDSDAFLYDVYVRFIPAQEPSEEKD